MENEMVQEAESGLTIGEVCRIIWKRIWYVLGASALVTLIAILLFVFVLNPRKVVYSGDFQVTYPLSETQKYPNGAPFFYHDMMTSTSLKQVVATDERLAKIDVDKLLKDEAVTFSAEIDEETKLYTGKYSIHLKGSYFSGYEEADSFADAIAAMFVARINEAAKTVSFEIDPALFANASYVMQLKFLADQKTKLLGEVDRWISVYHESYRIDGKTLKNIRTEIEGVYGDAVRKSLEAELDRCGFVPEGEIQNKITEIDAEIEYNLLQMAALEKAMETMGSDNTVNKPSAQSGIELYAAEDTSGSGTDESSKWVINISSVSDLLQTYAKYITRNEALNYQKTQLTKENVEKFAAAVMEQYTRLSEKAEMLADVTVKIYNANSRVLANQEELHSDGKTNVVFVAVAAFVVVFLLASLIVFCIDAPKYKRKKLAAENAAAGPAQKEEAHREEESQEKEEE